MFLDTVSQLKQHIITPVRDSVRLVPVVKRKPKVLRHWLLAAHKPQIIIIVLLVLIPFAITPLVDLLLLKIFSPVTEESLFGLIKTQEENPNLLGAQTFSHWMIWLMSAVLAIYLYLRHLPTTFEQVRKIANEKEVQADQLIAVNPSQSILLYDAAREWCVDEQAESALSSKLNSLNTKMRQVSDKSGHIPANTSDVAATLVSSAAVQVSEKALIADRYQIINELGSGAMGTVYLAEDLRLNRHVALKQLSPLLSADADQLARFRQEALVLARLSHPNIVQVYDFIEWDNLFLIAIELVEGGDLEDMLKVTEPLAINEIIRLTLQMAEALRYAHERGIVHRDLKPANVLISKSGEAKITDFGIAKLAQSSILTQVNTVMGSPAYMSPEQANGDSTDERTDIYSLGIVLYQMISGERPFNGDTKSIIAQHLTRVPPSLCEKREGISQNINNLVQKMLAKNPQERYQTIGEVIAQLKSHSK